MAARKKKSQRSTFRRNHGRGHGYTLDGQKTMGATTAIKGGLPAPALINWAGRMVAEAAADEHEFVAQMLAKSGRDAVVDYLKGAPWRDRDAAARRGTEVHSFGEQLVKGESVQVPEELEGHVKSYADWLDLWQPEPLAVEGVVISRKWGYMGTFDLICDIDDTRWLLDLKTTRSGVFAETVLQLAAYRYAESYLPDLETSEEISMPDMGIERTGVIWIRADGADLIPVETTPDVHRQFLYCLQTARDSDGLKARIGAPIYKETS